jgi:DNA-binding MarR family transcriptional regulator
MSETVGSAALRVAVMRLSRRMRQERGDGLSATQVSALAHLERGGPVGIGELAAAEKVQPPSMTKIVAGLVEAGLAIRSPHPQDGRQVLVSVTDAGRILLAAERRRRDEWLAARLAELHPQERRALAGALPVLQKLAES